ncbi:DUF1015 domain-containing protein [Flavobacterium agricola]|uniref:DUF1015 domain-containing protein n=1 Tax=Flavobacterium agricola TaxID=2870839 RepID=A0ABY6M099_9FLAO|nr:DUF1015 domain-containing protein [Flavobacterium agricola]UYW01861.1 DUF1015 domain-containing protein [Flavobacterium agricola]
MAKIIPFKAVRPTADKVSLVTARTYDDYSPAELAAQLDFNPYSFLHIINPGYALQQKITNEKRFKMVRNKYLDFKKDAVFKQETDPVFYIYEIQSNKNTFTGILCGTSIEDYQNNVIKKHENTLEYRVDMFKDYLHVTGFNTEPVLITYPNETELNTWLADQKQNTPIYEFSTHKKEKHIVWRIAAPTDIAWLTQKFSTIPNLYIADGHHRSASAEMLYNQDKETNNENLKYFMSFLIADDNVKIYEFNRLIHDLNNHSKQEFLNLLEKHFIVTPKGQEIWNPTQKFQFGMYLDGAFYALTLKKETYQMQGVLNQLDAQILYDTVLHPILGIGDLRNDDRIEYLPGTKSITQLKEKVDSGQFEVAFMLYPVHINEIKQIADNHLIMPPKSTYIEPKFCNGVIIYEI